MNDPDDNTPMWTARPIDGGQPPTRPLPSSSTTASMPDDSAIRIDRESADTADASTKPSVSRAPISAGDPSERSSSGLVMLGVVAATMLAVLGLGALISAVLTSGTTEAKVDADGEQAATVAESSPSSPANASSETSRSSSSVMETPTTPKDIEEFGTVADAHRQSAFARLEGLSLYLEGTVPSQELGDKVEARAALLLGKPAVKANYDVDPGVTLPTDPPLFASSTVLFEPDGTVNAGSMGTLNLAFSLLVDYPEARVIVSTPAPDELEEGQTAASEKQAAAVMQFWVDKGLDPGRVRVEVQGSPGSDSDDSGVLTREIEFVVRGLLTDDQL